MSSVADQVFLDLEERFNEAMASNDVEQISACISDDWSLITPESGPVSREGMLGAIANGVLTHNMMTKAVARVKVYDDIAIVTGRGQNTGTFKGEPIAADEWITDVYRLIDGKWLCVLTHLSPALGS
jgi:ketosteroid isomerase-like protein